MSTTDEKKSMVRMVGGYRGVLVIGDPWLGSPRRVGRVDQPWDASFSKLEQALEMARSRLLLPIIAGDLLHEHRDLLERITDALLDRETIDREDLALLEKNQPLPPRASPPPPAPPATPAPAARADTAPIRPVLGAPPAEPAGA